MQDNYFKCNVLSTELEFYTSEKNFSPSAIDPGTLEMIKAAFHDIGNSDKLLDLGCGYGAVGIFAAKHIGGGRVFMSDSDKLSIKMAKKNAELNNVNVNIIQSDAFKSLDETNFDLILNNPPYHADFSLPKEFIEKGFNRLKVGGKMYMVTHRKLWYKNKITSIFGGVKIHESQGYFVFEAEKRNANYAKQLPNRQKLRG